MKIATIEGVLTFSPISDWVYVKVTTDTGEVGWGECSLPAKPHALLGR